MTKLAMMVERLVKRTSEDLIDWEATVIEGEFLASLTNYAIKVRRYSNNNILGEYDYIVSILNEYGLVVEEISDEELSKQGLENSYQKLGDMYEKARGKAMGIDEAIDDILNFLGDDSDPF